jgi:ketopantoate reductase
MNKKKIAFVGAGAVGGYTGAHMVAGGEDVTFIPGPSMSNTCASTACA